MKIKSSIVALIWTMIIGGFLIGLSGCAGNHSPVTPLVDATPAQILIKTVEKTDWLATVGILGIGLSVFALLSGNTKFGIAGAGGFAVVLGMSLATARYHQQLALYGALVSTIGISGVLAYTIFIKNKALKEIIKNIQDYKYSNVLAWDVLKNKLEVQSPSTKEIVRQVKEKI